MANRTDRMDRTPMTGTTTKMRIETVEGEEPGQAGQEGPTPTPSTPAPAPPTPPTPSLATHATPPSAPPVLGGAPLILTAEQFTIMMKEMVREIKSNPELEAKNAEEKRRLEIRRRHRVRLASAEIERRNRQQAQCSHMKGEAGRMEPCLGGQVFSDGYERKICLRCQKVVVEIQAPELTAASEIIKTRMRAKAKELGIEDVIEELFNNDVPKSKSPSRLVLPGGVSEDDADDSNDD